MKLLETKEQLTLNELLCIAYEYGNDSADMPADAETVDSEFSEWIETTAPLFKKLIIPRVVGTCCENPHETMSRIGEDKFKCRTCGKEHEI